MAILNLSNYQFSKMNIEMMLFALDQAGFNKDEPITKIETPTRVIYTQGEGLDGDQESNGS